MKVTMSLKRTINNAKFLLRQNSQGFSLLEILIAITLLGIVGTFAASKIFDQLDEGKVKSTDIQIQSLAERMKEYRKDCNNYPTTEQGLDALITKPSASPECKNYAPNGYLDKGEVPKDPWENEFIFESDGNKFDIHSMGKDNQDGTADDIHYDKSKSRAKAQSENRE